MASILFLFLSQAKLSDRTILEQGTPLKDTVLLKFWSSLIFLEDLIETLVNL